MIETRTKQIERLKSNEDHIIFWDMDKGDQEFLKKVGPKNCEWLDEIDNHLVWAKKVSPGWILANIYRIRPDYHEEPPKPEIGEVYERAKTLFVICPDGKERAIHKLPCMADFEGFWLQGANLIGTADIPLDHVSHKLAAGHKVAARFRR